MSTPGPRHTYDDEQGSTARGIAVFAGILLATFGSFQILQGLSAIFEDDIFVTGINYIYEIDVTTWGWITLILGVIGVAVGVGILQGPGAGPPLRASGSRCFGPSPVRVHAVLPLLGLRDHHDGHPGDLGTGQADQPSLGTNSRLP